MKNFLKKITPVIIIKVYKKIYKKIFKQKNGKPVYKTEVINCPFCKSKDATPFRKGMDIVKCSACGLVYHFSA